jgi:hypothetical protein
MHLRHAPLIDIPRPACHVAGVPVEATYPHIVKPPGETARLERLPRVRVAQIVMDHLAHGWSVEEMCRHHPYLRLAEAHAAMAYYFDHQQEIDGEIEAEVRQTNSDRAAALQKPFMMALQGRLRKQE